MGVYEQMSQEEYNFFTKSWNISWFKQIAISSLKQDVSSAENI